MALQERECVHDLEANLNKLSQIELLVDLMKVSPISDLEIEKILVIARKILLSNIGVLKPTKNLIVFFTALAKNCFLNEYIFEESKRETILLRKLEREIIDGLDSSHQINDLKIACYFNYRKLEEIIENPK